MKTIVWKSENITKRSDNAQVLRVSAVLLTGRAPPRGLGNITGSFQGEAQLLMELLEREKALPRKAFERSPHGGHKHMPHTLEEAGFARCYHL